MSRPAAEIEAEATRVLATVPDWLWNGEELPVPVEDIADSCFGLLVRDIDDLKKAPGAPRLAAGQSFSGLLFPRRRREQARHHRKWLSESDGEVARDSGPA